MLNLDSKVHTDTKEQPMIISKTIKIKSEKLPPDVDFIISEIKKQGLDPVRFAIVEVEGNKLTISVSGIEI